MALSAQMSWAQPDFNASISDPTIGSGSTSTLIYTISNSGGAVTDLGFNLALPPGVSFASVPNPSTSCTGASASAIGTTFSFSNGVLAPSGSCTVSVNITSTIVATHTLTTGDLLSSGGNSGTATTSLTVANDRPGLTMSYSPNTLVIGQRSRLTVLVDSGPVAANFTSLNFQNLNIENAVVADPPNLTSSCITLANLSVTPGTTNVSSNFGDATLLNAGATCTIAFDVIGDALGTGISQLGSFSGTSFATFQPLTFGQAVAELTVTGGDFILKKEFIDDPVAPGNNATVEYTFTNFTRFDEATSIAFTDDFDGALSGLTIVDSANVSNCGAGASVTGSGVLSFTGGSLAPAQSCSFQVQLAVPASATTTSVPSSTSAVSLTLGSTPTSANQGIDTLFVQVGIAASKEFIDDPVAAGGSTTLRYTLQNQSLTETATDITFTENLAALGIGLNLGSGITLPAAGFCGAGSFVSQGDTVPSASGNVFGLTFAGLNLAAGTSCTFDVLLPIDPGASSTSVLSTSSDITATVGGFAIQSAGAADTLVVVGAPVLSKSFAEGNFNPGDEVVLTYTIFNQDLSNDVTAISFTDDFNAVIAGLSATSLPADGFCGPGSTISGTTILTVSNASLTADSSCSFDVTLSIPLSALPGSAPSTSSAISAINSGISVTGNSATTNLIIASLIFTARQVEPSAIPGSTATYEYSIENVSTEDATGIFFTHSISAGIPGAAAVPGAFNDLCGVGSSLTGTTFLIFTGGSVPAGQSCSFQVTVNIPAGAAPAASTQVTSSLTATLGGNVNVIAPASFVSTIDNELIGLAVTAPDTFITPGNNLQVGFELTNLDATTALTDLAFSFALNDVVTGFTLVNPANDICGAGSSFIDDGIGVVQLNDGTVPAGGSCEFSIEFNLPASANFAGAFNIAVDAPTGSLGGLAVVGSPASDSFQSIPAPGTSPSISIGAPSADSSTGEAISYLVTYTNAIQVSLNTNNVTLNPTGTAGGNIAISNVSNTSATVTITPTGEGTLGISIAAGTAQGTSTVLAPAAGPSATFAVDAVAPVITLNGDNPQTIELGDGYTELGASVDDGSPLVIDDSAFVDAVGTYLITYNATDAAGNDALQVTRTVNVVDTTAPVITLIGDNPQTIELGDGYTELGANVTDLAETNLVIDDSAFVDAVGTYLITYNATDASNNAATQVTRTVNVVDTTAPVITLIGDNPQTIELGAGYTELGANVTDLDTTNLVIDDSAFVDAVGTYVITYNATDASNNAATQVTRTVNVVDTTAPVITLIGDNPQTIELGDGYTELGANVVDEDTAPLVIDDSAFVDAIGTYEITYNATDASNNVAVTVTRTVNVVDTTAPVITLIGDDPQTIELGAGYTELGANVTDLTDTELVIDASAVLDAVGSYQVTYNATDTTGNNAIEVIRTVNVVDTTAPVISLIGDNPQTIELGVGYTELGANVTDLADTNLVIDSSAVLDEIGSYNVTYNATDASNNAAIEVIRVVNVVDTVQPVITLIGDNPQTIELGAGYTELGANVVDEDETVLVIDDSAFQDVVGTYEITYNATDTENNAAIEVIRTVNVVDTTTPAINLGEPSQAFIAGPGSVTYLVTYSDLDGIAEITLNAEDLLFSAVGDATFDIDISIPDALPCVAPCLGGPGIANEDARLITLSNFFGNGEFNLQIAAGTASDASGNLAPSAAAPSVTVDNLNFALALISAYADDQTNTEPTVDTFTRANVTGVTADNLASALAVIASVTGDEVDTTEEIQALLDRFVIDLIAPELPANATVAVETGADSANVSWDAATDANNLSYTLTVTDLVSDLVVALSETTELQTAISGLLPSRVHQFDLSASDEAGNTTAYPSVTASTSAAEDSDGNGLADNLQDGPGSTLDSDGDGISDDVENYLGVDTDFTTDLNDNGIPDVIEAELGIDVFDAGLADGFVGSSRPEISVSNNPISLLAQGIFTQFDTGVSATNTGPAGLRGFQRFGLCAGDILPANFEDICLPVQQTGSGELVSLSGDRAVWWIAVDENGNWPLGGALLQGVNILPQASFGATQQTAVGGNLMVELTLSGELVDPDSVLEVPFTLVSDSTGGAATDGVFQFDDSLEATVQLPIGPNAGSIMLALDTTAAPFAQDENTIDLGIDRIASGAQTQLEIEVVNENLPPVVSLSFENALGQPIFAALTGEAGVEVVATAFDPNGDALELDWSTTSDFEVPTDLTTSRFGIDISATGGLIRTVTLTVSDGQSSTSVTAILLALSANPFLLVGDDDDDNDGLSDVDEGLLDLNGDGIPDAAQISGLGQMSLPLLIDSAAAITTEPGLSLALGEAATRFGGFGAVVEQMDLEGETLFPEDDVPAISQIVDFEVLGLNQAGQQINVVIPLNNAIPGGAVYRKYFAEALPDFPGRVDWQTFDTSSLNAAGNPDSLASAMQIADGICPDFDDPIWAQGLNSGDNCLRLTITDGGPNDADGSANLRVADPGFVGAQVLDPSGTTLEVSDTTLIANANDSATVTLTVQDLAGNGVDGLTVALNATSGGSLVTLPQLTDNGDGTYTGTITAANSPGTLVFVASVSGLGVSFETDPVSIELTPGVTLQDLSGGCSIGSGKPDWTLTLMLALILIRLAWLSHRRASSRARVQ